MEGAVIQIKNRWEGGARNGGCSASSRGGCDAPLLKLWPSGVGKAEHYVIAWVHCIL